MARGLPALWSMLFGLPLVGGGVGLHLADRYLQSFASPLVALGCFVVLVGIVIQFINPEPPAFREDETVLDTRHPNLRPAVLKSVASVPCFLVAAHLLYFTRLPYLYPTAAFFAGLFLYSGGLLTYWRNSLRTYYLTDQRFISVYRFLTLDRTEIALEDVRLIQERKSITETLVDLGNVRVAAGVADLEIVASNIRNPTAFADEIRDRSA